MPVPTLPVFNWPAPLDLFLFLQYGDIALVIVLFLCTSALALSASFCCFRILYTVLRAISNAITRHCMECIRRQCTEAETPTTRKSKLSLSDCCRKCDCKVCLKSCETWLCKCWGWLRLNFKPKMRSVSRWLNVKMFPSLFKEHEEQTNNHTVTRKFLFLDREVEKNCLLIFSFWSLAFAIFGSSLLVFFRYIPVAISTECLERDDNLRSLFCYTNESTWPVDCDTYNTTELEEVDFVCYAITIPSVGLAYAAASGLASLATKSISIYIRASSVVYKWSRGSACLYNFYLTVTLFSLYGFAIGSYLFVTEISTGRLDAAGADRLSGLPYLAYGILPLMLIPSLFTIMCTLNKHCEQVKYISSNKDDSDVYSVRTLELELEGEKAMHTKMDTLPTELQVSRCTENHTDVTPNGTCQLCITVNPAYGARN